MYIGNKVYAFTNVQEAVDYFGITDDMAVAKLSALEDAMIKSACKPEDKRRKGETDNG